ncbi:hypothetical protein BDV25DRAFT_143313 [Aspergillus avenaceus]|uniref:Receptor L-domain domain-containing protein n=1 Tax=Aspergillus avenaceus TaxID=36643 RepID=A0A5N6TKJ0_ASPAV|nr:hypothetical protein BDV25DRAFT_143313 [Aspergillus avenaceus]
MKVYQVVIGFLAVEFVVGDTCTARVEISSQTDADALNDCETIANSLTFSSSANGTISIPDVQDVKGPFTIEGTSSLNAVSANDLEKVTGPITIKDNKALNSVSLSGLEKAGGEVRVEGNEGLKEVKLDDLETVNGPLILKGEFDRISLSNLEHVYGETVIESTGSFLCSSLSKQADKNVFQSSYSCSEHASTSSLSPGAKAGIAVGVIIGVIIVLLALWLFIRRQRKRKRNMALAGAAAVGGDAEKGTEKGAQTSTVSSTTVSTPSGGTGVVGNGGIPRKPLSPPPPPTTVPAALVPGDRGSATPTNTDDPSLFLRPMPRRRPSESDVPMLDSENVHEAPPVEPGRRQEGLHELDAGPVSGRHQQAIHGE